MNKQMDPIAQTRSGPPNFSPRRIPAMYTVVIQKKGIVPLKSG
jgi:hypothetical protein